MKKWFSVLIALVIFFVLSILTYHYRYCFTYMTSIRLDSSGSPVNEGQNLGTFGDYIGGVYGTIAGLISTILLFLAFLQQKEEFAKLRKDADKSSQDRDFDRIQDLIYKQLDLFNSQLRNTPLFVFPLNDSSSNAAEKESSLTSFVAAYLGYKSKFPDALNTDKIFRKNFYPVVSISKLINVSYFLVDDRIKNCELDAEKKRVLTKLFGDNMARVSADLFASYVPDVISNKGILKTTFPENDLHHFLLMIDQAHKHLNKLLKFSIPKEKTIMHHYPDIVRNYQGDPSDLL